MNEPSSEPPRFYVTTAIPYVNAKPHIGFALEAVQTDVLARYQRWKGADVRFLTGTDENSLKNVRAAEQAGVPTQELVGRLRIRAFCSMLYGNCRREQLSPSSRDFA